MSAHQSLRPDSIFSRFSARLSKCSGPQEPQIPLNTNLSVEAQQRALDEALCALDIGTDRLAVGFDEKGEAQCIKPSTHVGIIGSSGSGKSKLMAFFAYQFAHLIKGHVQVIDCIGDRGFKQDMARIAQLAGTDLVEGLDFRQCQKVDGPKAGSVAVYDACENPVSAFEALKAELQARVHDQFLKSKPMLLLIPESARFIEAVGPAEFATLTFFARAVNVRLVYDSQPGGIARHTSNAEYRAGEQVLLANTGVFCLFYHGSCQYSEVRALNLPAAWGVSQMLNSFKAGQLLIVPQSYEASPQTARVPFFTLN